MRKEVWKYNLRNADSPKFISMPRGATILSVQMQGNEPMLWALVDPDASKVPRTILTFGTGQGIRAELGQYIGTYQIEWTVWHVFEGVRGGETSDPMVCPALSFV